MRSLVTIKFICLCFWKIHALIPAPHSLNCYRCRYATATQPRSFGARARSTALKGSNGLDNNNNSNSIVAADNKIKDPLAILPQLHTYQKPRQTRRPQTTLTRPRKPRYYWHSLENLKRELDLFWDELDVPIRTINPDQPPPVPSEYLLNYFHRNDLRWAIAQMGGRENVSYLLGGAKVIPGKWKDARELEEAKHLIPRMEEYYKCDLPLLKRKRKELETNAEEATSQNGETVETQQSHHEDQKQGGSYNTETMLEISQHYDGNVQTNMTLMSLVSSAAPDNRTKRQLKEFWSKEKVVKELYQYLESYRKYNQRPAVWAPQLAEISHEGYSKLFNACSRFEKLPCASVFIENDHDEAFHSVAGLVPFQEWRFFESQLQLFVELQHYLRLHHNGTEEFFPEPPDVLMHGHKQLHDLIRIHGGKTLLAQKLDMKFAWDHTYIETNGATSGNDKKDRINPSSHLSWGPFKLEFATQLLHLIRSQYLLLNPPLASSLISMPSEKDLLSCGRDDLARQVVCYGGYENVARRLGLSYFDGKSQRMERMRYRGAKLLWKDRHNQGVLSSSSSIKGRVRRRKMKGLAWDEDLVIEELNAYFEVNVTNGSTVMPTFRQLDEDDRGDLARAISKFGGMKHIERKLILHKAGQFDGTASLH